MADTYLHEPSGIRFHYGPDDEAPVHVSFPDDESRGVSLVALLAFADHARARLEEAERYAGDTAELPDAAITIDKGVVWYRARIIYTETRERITSFSERFTLEPGRICTCQIEECPTDPDDLKAGEPDPSTVQEVWIETEAYAELGRTAEKAQSLFRELAVMGDSPARNSVRCRSAAADDEWRRLADHLIEQGRTSVKIIDREGLSHGEHP